MSHFHVELDLLVPNLTIVSSLQNAPEINDIVTPAHLDVLIVNIIRGTALSAACLWILGRRAAVSQIPSRFIDIVTEIQGFRFVRL